MALLKIAALCYIVLLACAASTGLAQDAAIKSEARRMYHELYCVVCDGQSLAESRAKLAVDTRAYIMSELRAGTDAETIKANLVARYGEKILTRPPVNPSTYLLWASPFLVLLLGALLLVRARS